MLSRWTNWTKDREFTSVWCWCFCTEQSVQASQRVKWESIEAFELILRSTCKALSQYRHLSLPLSLPPCSDTQMHFIPNNSFCTGWKVLLNWQTNNYIPIVLLILSGLCPEPGGVPFSHRTMYDGPYNLGSEVIYKCNLGASEFVLSCKAQNQWAGKQNCAGSVVVLE